MESIVAPIVFTPAPIIALTSGRRKGRKEGPVQRIPDPGIIVFFWSRDTLVELTVLPKAKEKGTENLIDVKLAPLSVYHGMETG